MQVMTNYISQHTRKQFSSDFWKFWTGQTISKLGSSFTGFALPLLIFTLTHSPLNLAFTVVATVLPYLLFGLVIGAWTDRVNRKRFMVLTDLTRALVIASIPLAFTFGVLSVWWIYAVAFLTSTLTIGFDAADFAAIPGLVSQDDLVTANGHIQASYSTAKIIGPLLAGLLIFVLPIPLLLLVDAASFLISAVLLLLIKTSFNAPLKVSTQTSIRQSIIEGLHYVLNQPVLRWTTILLLFCNFILPTANTQLVLFAKQWLGASDTKVSFLYAGSSLGTVLFSLLAGRLSKHWSSSTILLGAIALEGLLTAVSALTHSYWLALCFWILRGGADVLFLINSYSLVQSMVPNHLLGRVITFIRVLTWSTASLGALIGGFAIEQTHNIGLIYISIGILIALLGFACTATPLAHAKQYLPETTIPQP